MPHVIKEFNWVLHPLLVLAPDQSTLKKFFEDISFELTTDIGPGENLGLRTFAVPGPGPLNFWLSCTLGARGKGYSRLSILGLSLEAEVKDMRRLFSLIDGGIVLASKDHPNFEKLMRGQEAKDMALKPWVFCGPAEQDPPFRLKALRQWMAEHVDRTLWNPRPDRLLEDSLAWILEEST